MAIDVPYSYLLRDGDIAWTCGQLALDDDGHAVAPGDLAAQSAIVSSHIEAVLDQADLDPAGLARAYLYTTTSDGAARSTMLETFRTRFGQSIDLVVIPVPHFYYPGVELEVDVLWTGPEAGIIPTSGPGGAHRLSEHAVVGDAQDLVNIADPGAAIVGESQVADTIIVGLDIAPDGNDIYTSKENSGDVSVVVRHSPPFTWVQGRGTDAAANLVSQTTTVMDHIADALTARGLDFSDVAKSTTHYAGGASAEELHSNMAVRNRRYSAPGPASTGIPVSGFADSASKVVVDVTLVRR